MIAGFESLCCERTPRSPKVEVLEYVGRRDERSCEDNGCDDSRSVKIGKGR